MRVACWPDEPKIGERLVAGHEASTDGYGMRGNEQVKGTYRTSPAHAIGPKTPIRSRFLEAPGQDFDRFQNLEQESRDVLALWLLLDAVDELSSRDRRQHRGGHRGTHPG